MSGSHAPPVLRVRGLGVRFATARGPLQALDAVNLDVPAGHTLAIVGESGSGKSVLSRAIMRLLPPSAAITPGAEISFDGQNLLAQPERKLQHIRGRRIAMVFQDPMTSLNPVRTIGVQLTEGMRRHLGLSRSQAHHRATELLTRVGLSSPARRMDQYPHELSGGMRQRVVIAMAIACDPELLIADEPTTALDVTVQAEILDLLRSLQRERQMTLILITHDLGVAAEQADRIAVMYAGQIVEQASTAELFGSPRMPYTHALLRAIPTLEDPAHARLFTIGGRPPAVVGEMCGCHFAPRCPYVQERCHRDTPSMSTGPMHEHAWRCWYPLEASR